MYITINNKYSGNIIEDPLLSENEDVIGLFSEICREIDNMNIAKFSVLFKQWDDKFDNTDFAYDFTSVATELPGLIQFLQSKIGNYSLGFYELDRKIEFNFQERMLHFSIYRTMGVEILYHDELESEIFMMTIKKLIADFRNLLSKYFPKAYEIFLRERYIFT